jgi:indolepyruvate ferredoxin oxidoreductase
MPETENLVFARVAPEYRQLIDEAIPVVPYETGVRIAASALSIKGYGPIKETAVAAWREHVAGLLA